MQGRKNAFANSTLTNLSDISYNDRDEHSRNTNYDAEILTGTDVDPSNTYRYKKVSKSLLRFKNVKIKRLFFNSIVFQCREATLNLYWNKSGTHKKMIRLIGIGR